MSDDYPTVEVITGAGRRRYWPIEEKLRIVEETLQPGATISAVARCIDPAESAQVMPLI